MVDKLKRLGDSQVIPCYPKILISFSSPRWWYFFIMEMLVSKFNRMQYWRFRIEKSGWAELIECFFVICHIILYFLHQNMKEESHKL